jgi:REP element-mobilizing transposase RayT
MIKGEWRALRVLFPGAWYHVVNRGIERRVIFYGEAYYQKFEEVLGLLVQQYGVRIHSYVLMYFPRKNGHRVSVFFSV